ncbi:hypothetical protein CDAR_468761 [Caerostris darwini]|uniref:Uncharacterized protein n=1 Tax=Caerostris darwini TaxID=1538125 RepID=A0AAV4T9Z8_9ARAC|nr:hypothetical protein CDAR_468761 [Caerostris darwini]
MNEHTEYESQHISPDDIENSSRAVQPAFLDVVALPNNILPMEKIVFIAACVLMDGPPARKVSRTYNEWTQNMKVSIFHQTISKTAPEPPSQLSMTLLPFRKIFYRWKKSFSSPLAFDGRASCEKGRGRGTRIRRKVSKCDH